MGAGPSVTTLDRPAWLTPVTIRLDVFIDASSLIGRADDFVVKLQVCPGKGTESQTFKTDLKRTLHDIMCWYPSAARSSGKTSIIGRTPLATANLSASSESLETPEGHPMIDLRVINICNEETAKGSELAPTITNVPPAESPSIKVPIALPSGAVA